MDIIFGANAAREWALGHTVMTAVTLDLPHWPVRIRLAWIESPDPMTHRISDETRRRVPAEYQALLDEVDDLLRAGNSPLAN